MADLDQAVLAFRLLGDRLRREAADDLRRELNKAIRDAASPAVASVRNGLPVYLPNRYAAVLDSDMQINISQTQTGVRIRAPERGSRTVERRRLLRLNRGVLGHPLFGDRAHWYSQAVRPGFFDEPLQRSAPEVREKIVDAMHTVAGQLTRKG